MDCRLTRGKQPELVIELGSTKGNGIGLRRLASGWSRPEQIELCLYGGQRGLGRLSLAVEHGRVVALERE